MSMPLLKKNTDKLESNIQHVEENIRRCLAYKESYEHERNVGNKFLKNLQIEFNLQIDGIISIIVPGTHGSVNILPVHSAAVNSDVLLKLAREERDKSIAGDDNTL